MTAEQSKILRRQMPRLIGIIEKPSQFLNAFRLLYNTCRKRMYYGGTFASFADFEAIVQTFLLKRRFCRHRLSICIFVYANPSIYIISISSSTFIVFTRTIK